MAVAHDVVRAGMDHLVGLGGEGGWCDRGLSGGVRGLAGHAQHHGGRLLGGLRRQLEVGRHERVLRRNRRLDGRGYSDDGRLCGHAVAVGGLQGVGVWQKAGLAYRCYRRSPGWAYRHTERQDR